MNQNYMNMSMNDIIKFIKKRDKQIEELNQKISDMKNTVKELGVQRDIKNDLQRFYIRVKSRIVLHVKIT